MKMIMTFCSLMAVLSFCSRSKFGVIGTGSNEKPEGKAVSYRYTYSGTMAYPIEFFEVEKTKDGILRLGYSKNDNDIHQIRIPEETLDTITRIAEENKLYKLKESYRPRMEVLDGYGWYVSIRYEKGYISSGGSNAWPAQVYSDAIDAINSHLRSLIEKSAPQDSLGVAHHHNYNLTSSDEDED